MFILICLCLCTLSGVIGYTFGFRDCGALHDGVLAASNARLKAHLAEKIRIPATRSTDYMVSP